LPPPGTATLVLTALLLIQAWFQAGLALGADWGQAAWGGAHPTVLPAGLRLASGVAALAWAWLCLVVVGRSLGPAGRRRALLVLALYAALGAVLNAISPSVVERVLWVPWSVLVAFLAFRERPLAPGDPGTP
jgi:hypothetical protein